MSGGPRLGRLGLVALRERLSERDELILDHVARLRLLRARQVQALLFPDDQHANAVSAARCCRRVLERLSRERLLVRLERRVGGVRAGSASYVYALGPVGQRVLSANGPRRRLEEPSARFVGHTLAVADLLVAVTLHTRAGGVELIEWQSEPDAWRQVATLGGKIWLRPDMFLVLDVGGYELRWFVELDQDTEHLPAIRSKCRLYNTYYRSGSEQRRHSVFPRVLWIAPNAQRADKLRTAIAADKRLAAGLFRVSQTSEAIAALTEATP